MEQTALRPRPMPGREPGGNGGAIGDGPEDGAGRRRPHAVRRRGRRLLSAMSGVLAGTVLMLSGAGLGVVGAEVVGVGGPAGPERYAGPPAVTPSASPSPAPPAPAVPAVGGLGVEVADGTGPGAVVVGVHVPGPGFSAGLVRGDVVLALGTTRIDSAAALARAVARVRPGDEVTLTVRHRDGARQRLTAVPGIVT